MAEWISGRFYGYLEEFEGTMIGAAEFIHGVAESEKIAELQKNIAAIKDYSIAAMETGDDSAFLQTLSKELVIGFLVPVFVIFSIWGYGLLCGSSSEDGAVVKPRQVSGTSFPPAPSPPPPRQPSIVSIPPARPPSITEGNGGCYCVVAPTLVITVSKDDANNDNGTLKAGDVVEIDELQLALNRVRGHLSDNRGWITLHTVDKSDVWAEAQ